MFDGQHCHEGCVRNRTELAQCVESDKEFHTECPGRVGFVKVPDWARFPLVSSPGPTLGHHHEASGPRERFHADPMRIHERRPRGIRPSSTWNRGSGWRPLTLETREGQPTHLWQASTTESVRPRIRIRDQNLRCVETSVKEGGRMPRSHRSMSRRTSRSHVTGARHGRTSHKNRVTVPHCCQHAPESTDDERGESEFGGRPREIPCDPDENRRSSGTLGRGSEPHMEPVLEMATVGTAASRNVPSPHERLKAAMCPGSDE